MYVFAEERARGVLYIGVAVGVNTVSYWQNADERQRKNKRGSREPETWRPSSAICLLSFSAVRRRVAGPGFFGFAVQRVANLDLR